MADEFIVYLTHLKSRRDIFLRINFTKDPGEGSSEGPITPFQKTPVEILVQQSPLQPRLYLFSLNTLLPEVIIRKNAEPGWNN